jgi:peptidoglycan-N-acetylglucosamine deacetylase
VRSKRVADLSLDLDNKWSYLKTHGDESWSAFPSYLDVVVPHVIQVLDSLNLKITVFVVGQDAVIESNQAALKSFVREGHEIANHSFHHEPWLQRYSREQIVEEFDRTEAALALITDQPLRGFRGPGYCLSEDILNLLAERGYVFDASTFPTFLGPIARAYCFFRSNLSKEQSEDRGQLFGSIKDGLRPLKPYMWQTRHGELLELPVTTMPIFRAPFHFTYLHHLAQFSETLAVAYFRMAICLCRLFGIGPSLLLHPLDFLGHDDVDGLEFFPGMKLAGARKRAFVARILQIYASAFDVRSMTERARFEISKSPQGLPKRQADLLG